MSLARALAVLILLIILFGACIYSFHQIDVKMAKLMGKPVEEKPIIDYNLAYNILWIASIMIAIVVTPIALVTILLRRKRILGVIRVQDLQKHILIFGPTGSGKTSTALSIIEKALKKNINIDVLDWKGEYTDKARGANIIRKINLLEPPDWSQTHNHTLVVVDILRDVLDLSEPMAYMLYEELSKMYEDHVASFRKLMEQLRYRRAAAIAQYSRAEANIAEALIRRILPLVLDESRQTVDLKGDSRITIYDLSELPTYQLKTLYSEIILWRLYNEAVKERSHTLRKLIVMEECQNYVRPRRSEMPPSIGERIVNELRAYGYGAILISPDPHQIPIHMPRDAGAVVSIGYQALPEIVSELLNVYRYADVRRLLKTTSKPRTYIYYNGRLYIKSVPKPYRRIIDLGFEATPILHEAEKTEAEEKPKILKVEEEKVEEGPSSGAIQA